MHLGDVLFLSVCTSCLSFSVWSYVYHYAWLLGVQTVTMYLKCSGCVYYCRQALSIMPADEGPAQKIQRQSATSPATIGDIVDFTGVRMLDQDGDNDQQLFESQLSVSIVCVCVCVHVCVCVCVCMCVCVHVCHYSTINIFLIAY